MSEEDAFLDGITADRADRTRLLVFADWLADRSDPREEFVRLHTRLLDMDGTEPEFAELEKEWAGWTGSVPLAPGYLPGATHPARLNDRWLDSICRAFTTGDVADYLVNPLVRPATDLDRRDFDAFDHIHSGGEEELVLYHGTAALFDGPLHFVACSVLRDLWGDPFQTASVGEAARRYLAPVTLGSFWQRWRGHCAGLRNPPPSPAIAADNHFLGAQYIEGDWNNWAFVAIHRDDYFALFWSTTA
jgi:uncharacterized protein (TIGR02996 family)